MSSKSVVKPGTVTPFPPLPGQPWPPARNHPRWKELYRLHDEWLMSYWPFSNENKKIRVPFMNLAGFCTWCAPAGDFTRMVWGVRLFGSLFMADDLLDSGKMLGRIPGFKEAARGEGPLHPEDRVELCLDIAFRAIKATCNPRTFGQLTECAHEFWDGHFHEPFGDLDQFLAARCINIGMYLSSAVFRYCLDIDLTDEQVKHPLMRMAEGIMSDHVGMVNDIFSYAKEFMTQSDDRNILRILQDIEGMTYVQALEVVSNKISQKEQEFVHAGLAVLNHPDLGQDPEVHRWISCLSYVMGGNIAWSQETGRYNVGNIPGVPTPPALSYNLEDTPQDEMIDDIEESALRELVFNVEAVPKPDFVLEIEAIETKGARIVAQAVIPPSLQLMNVPGLPKQHVGLRAIFISQQEDGSDSNVVLKAAAGLLMTSQFSNIVIEKVEVRLNNAASEVDAVDLVKLLNQSELELTISRNECSSLLLDAIAHVESRVGKGSDFLAISASERCAVAMLIGRNAPIIIEPALGVFTPGDLDGNGNLRYRVTMQSAYQSYLKRLRTLFPEDINVDEAIKAAASFDYMIADRPDDLELLLQTSSHDESELPLTCEGLKKKLVRNGPAKGTIYEGLTSLISTVPSYDLFEKRIAVSYKSGGTFFCLRVVGDTEYMRGVLREAEEGHYGNK